MKTHYYTTREESERVEQLRHSGAMLFGDEADLLTLLSVADVVVSDNSSAIFDAILADKPVVVADFWDEQFLDFEHKELREYARGSQGALTYSGSIEQQIKRDGTVVTLKKPNELRDGIADALADTKLRRQKRKELRDELFAYQDAECGKRAADAIKKCIEDKQSTKRPALYHAIEAYKRRIGVLSYGRERKLLKEIELYKRLAHERIERTGGLLFSIIWNANGEADDMAASFRALTEIDFPASSYEIIACGISESTLRQKFSTVKVRVTVAPNILPAAHAASATYLAFTSSDCVVPSDWLARLYDAYERHPSVVGVGGIVLGKNTSQTAYGTFAEFNIAKYAGFEVEPFPITRLFDIVHRVYYTHPAGVFSNMSYRADTIKHALDHAEDTPSLEQYLKIIALRSGSLCFIPSIARLSSPTTFRDFFRGEREAGFNDRYYRDLALRNRQTWALRPKLSWADAFRAARARKTPLLIAVVWISRCARFLGGRIAFGRIFAGLMRAKRREIELIQRL